MTSPSASRQVRSPVNYEISELQAAAAGAVRYHTARVDCQDARIFVDTRWGSWQAVAGDGSRREIAPELAADLAGRVRKLQAQES